MKTENRKGRFNVIDVFLILLALLCIFSVVYRATDIDTNLKGRNLKEYRVYFKVDDIRSSSLGYFVAGDNVRIKQNNKTFGTLDGIVQYVPAVGAYNENGGEVFYPNIDKPTVYNDTRYSLVGYITVRGEMKDGGFMLGGEQYLSSNSTLEIVTERIQTTIRIISITEK